MTDTFKTFNFPKSRLATLDVGQYGRDKHYMFGLLEVDVTNARQAARRLRQTGQGVSFTAWMIKAVAGSVARHKEVHAVAIGKRRIVVFDSVDIALPVEREVEQGRAPLPLLIKGANSRTVFDIHNDIEAALHQAVDDESCRFQKFWPHRFQKFWPLQGGPEWWKSTTRNHNLSAGRRQTEATRVLN